ncbi:MAG: PadR family transcriptional regulator [Candidatus Hodarchaeota archaeon]
MDNSELLQKWQVEYKKGYAKPILLMLLSEGKNYPYQLTKQIFERTKGQIAIASSNIYPVISSLVKEGLVVEEKSDESRRIIYSATDKGISFLKELKESIKEFIDLIDQLIAP